MSAPAKFKTLANRGKRAIKANRAIVLGSIAVIAIAGGAAGFHVWNESQREHAAWAVVENYCLDCHNGVDLAGERSFESLAPATVAANAEVWEAAIRKLRGGLMPPAGSPRPETDAVGGIL